MQTLRPDPRPSITFRAASITKVFGDTIALWDVDLEGRTGDLITVLGANGSGKSTLLRIIAGLITPSGGQVAWTTDHPGRGPRIGLLGHANHLFEELTPIENVTMAARLARRDATQALDLLGRLGVAHAGARRTGDLSAGTRRRIGLARVLATDPDVLLVDEPFAGLDRAAADLVGEALADSRDVGRMVVIATHDDTRSRRLTTFEARLDAGRVGPGMGWGVGALAT